MKPRKVSLAGVKSYELLCKPKKGHYRPRNPLLAAEARKRTAIRAKMRLFTSIIKHQKVALRAHVLRSTPAA
jgi:hypothetical protein